MPFEGEFHKFTPPTTTAKNIILFLLIYQNKTPSWKMILPVEVIKNENYL